MYFISPGCTYSDIDVNRMLKLDISKVVGKEFAKVKVLKSVCVFHNQNRVKYFGWYFRIGWDWNVTSIVVVNFKACLL